MDEGQIAHDRPGRRCHCHLSRRRRDITAARPGSIALALAMSQGAEQTQTWADYETERDPACRKEKPHAE
jgi:hypothetical protein